MVPQAQPLPPVMQFDGTFQLRDLLKTDEGFMAFVRNEFCVAPSLRMSKQKLAEIRRLYLSPQCRFLIWEMRAGKSLSVMLCIMLRLYLDRYGADAKLLPQPDSTQSWPSGRLILILVGNDETAVFSWIQECFMVALGALSKFMEVILASAPSDFLKLREWKARAAENKKDAVVVATYSQLQAHFERVARKPGETRFCGFDAYTHKTIKQFFDHVDSNLWQHFVDTVWPTLSLDRLVDHLVLDEAQMVKNFNCQRGLAARLLAACVPPENRWLLTGTPAGNKPETCCASLMQLVFCYNRNVGRPAPLFMQACHERFWKLEYNDRNDTRRLSAECNTLRTRFYSKLTFAQAYSGMSAGTQMTHTEVLVQLQADERSIYLDREAELVKTAKKLVGAATLTPALQKRARIAYMAHVSRAHNCLVFEGGRFPELFQALRNCHPDDLHPKLGQDRVCCNPACEHHADVDEARRQNKSDARSFGVISSPRCAFYGVKHYLCRGCIDEQKFTDCPRCISFPAAFQCGIAGRSHLLLSSTSQIVLQPPVARLCARPSSVMYEAMQLVLPRIAKLKTPWTNSDKTIVVCNRKTDCVLFAVLLEKLLKPGNVLVFSGAFTKWDSTQLLTRFKTCTTCRVMVAVPQKITTGLDLTVASHMVFVGQGWSASSVKQLEARITGPAQKSATHVDVVLVAGTVMEAMYRSNQASGELQAAVVNGTSTAGSEALRLRGHILRLADAREPLAADAPWPTRFVLDGVQCRGGGGRIPESDETEDPPEIADNDLPANDSDDGDDGDDSGMMQIVVGQ